MDIVSHNRTAWNKQSTEGSPWCNPVSSAEIEAARRGDWKVFLTPNISVPRAWFGIIAGRQVLCLASGGGQQAPLLTAAGARVTSFDNSNVQLDKDRLVATRDSLELATVQGDMADLTAFADNSFDLIFHPVSNVFTKDIRPVWKECYRVLRNGGRLLAGFMNPMFYLFDHQELEQGGEFIARYTLPFSDLESLPSERLDEIIEKGEALEFGHMLDDQIGGQIDAGFVLTGFYEDSWNEEATPLNKFGPFFISTLTRKVRVD